MGPRSSAAASLGGDADAAGALSVGLDALSLPLDEATRRRLLRFVELLAKWNRVYNLTAVDDPRDMLVVHLLDSLAIVPLIDRLAPASVVDVGSGAGLPGIPLAVARPSVAVTTVDAVAKKIAFQRHCKAELGIANLEPIHARVEALTLLETPTVIVSRAFATLATMLRTVDAAAGSATRIVAMKAAAVAAELRDVPTNWSVDAVEPLDVPFLGAARCAVVLSRRGSPP